MDLPCGNHCARCRASEMNRTGHDPQGAHSLVERQIVRCRVRGKASTWKRSSEAAGDFSDEGEQQLGLEGRVGLRSGLALKGQGAGQKVQIKQKDRPRCA